MFLAITIQDKDENLIIPDSIFINGIIETPASIIVKGVPDNSTFSILIQKDGYYTYSQTFKVYDIDIDYTITLISLDCKRFDEDLNEYVNECCNNSIIVIDNPCNNVKQIVKASSSPAPIYVYKNQVFIGKGEVITIGEELICEDVNEFLIVSRLEKDCGCDGTDYPPCYEEFTLEIPKQNCLCNGSFSFAHDYCYDKIFPFIDFETTKFFNQERWYLVTDVFTEFIFALPCIRTNLLVYNQNIQSYEEVEYRKEVNVYFALKKDNEEIVSLNLSLEENFTDEELSIFISNFILSYIFEEKGKHTLVAEVSTICGLKKYEKEILVTDDINLFVKEDCRLYDLIICNDIFDISIRRITETNPITEISYNQGEITGNTDKIFLQTNQGFELNFGLEDGVYEITINNGLEEKKFIVVHFCQAKNCYISLTKKLYCNEAIVNDRFMYSVVTFFMLYKLVIEYYTLSHPIETLETTLSNSDNLKYIEIDKALEKIKQICNDCGSSANEEGVYEDCGCGSNESVFKNLLHL